MAAPEAPEAVEHNLRKRHEIYRTTTEALFKLTGKLVVSCPQQQIKVAAKQPLQTLQSVTLRASPRVWGGAAAQCHTRDPET